VAKQNYRCAGCGIRTDPGESLVALYCPRGLCFLPHLSELVREGDREEMGKRKEGPGSGGKPRQEH
jgi:hypothetical protein